MRLELPVQGTHFWESDGPEGDPGSVILGILCSPDFFIHQLGVLRPD